jgi:hypothetical protein
LLICADVTSYVFAHEIKHWLMVGEPLQSSLIQPHAKQPDTLVVSVAHVFMHNLIMCIYCRYHHPSNLSQGDLAFIDWHTLYAHFMARHILEADTHSHVVDVCVHFGS